MRRPDRQLPFPWKTFVRHHHGRRPTVFRDVLDRPLASSGEVFEAFLALMSGEHRSSALRIAGNGQRQLDLDLDMLPRSADRSVAGYVTRLSRRVSDPGIAVNHLQAGSSVLFGRVVPFLDALYSRIGVPTGGALLDLFAGTYRQSFVGLHKDEQDVFTFVLSGRKRFLLWPFETLADRFGVGEGARFRPHTLTEWGGRLETLRDDAMVVEAGPRDVIYWPSSYWHIAESDGAFVSTLALGIFPRTKPVLLGEALANTAERISNYETRGAVHRWFHNLSSFQEASPRPRKEPLRCALQALPPKVVFKALFFSFMHASFLYKRLGREELARVRDHIGGEARHVLPLFREGLGLSVDFRVRTQELYFRFHHRLDRSIFELTDFDFVEELERHPRALAQVDALAELLTSPTPRTPAARRLAGSS